MILLIDIGNSRLKWAVAVNGRINTGKPIYHQKGQLDCAFLMNEWERLDQPIKVIISNVAGQRIADSITDLVQQLWQQVPFFTQSVTQQFGVRNGYDNPSQLGVDRWVALLAAAHHYPLPACIIDCGSAITIDVIDATGLHLGGLIAPGIYTMKQSIIQGTSQINDIQEDTPIGLSGDTATAVNSGILLSGVGLIEQAIANEIKNNKIGLKSLLLCGGDAEIISARLKYSVTIDQDLIFKGLLILRDKSS